MFVAIWLHSSVSCLFTSWAVVSFGLFALFSSVCKSSLNIIDGNPLFSASQILFLNLLSVSCVYGTFRLTKGRHCYVVKCACLLSFRVWGLPSWKVSSSLDRSGPAHGAPSRPVNPSACEDGPFHVQCFWSYYAKVVCLISSLSCLSKCSFLLSCFVNFQAQGRGMEEGETTALTTEKNGLLPAIKPTV